MSADWYKDGEDDVTIEQDDCIANYDTDDDDDEHEDESVDVNPIEDDTPLLRWFFNYNHATTSDAKLLTYNVPFTQDAEFATVFHTLFGGEPYREPRILFQVANLQDASKKTTDYDKITMSIHRIVDGLISIEHFKKVLRSLGMFASFTILFRYFDGYDFNGIMQHNFGDMLYVCALFYKNILGATKKPKVDENMQNGFCLLCRSIEQRVSFAASNQQSFKMETLTYYIEWLKRMCVSSRANELRVGMRSSDEMNAMVQTLPDTLEDIVNSSIANFTVEMNKNQRRIYREGMLRLYRSNINVPLWFIHAYTENDTDVVPFRSALGVGKLDYHTDAELLYKCYKSNDMETFWQRFLETTEMKFTTRASPNFGIDDGTCQAIRTSNVYHECFDIAAYITKNDPDFERITKLCIDEAKRLDSGGSVPLAIKPMCFAAFDADVVATKYAYTRGIVKLIKILFQRLTSMHACNEMFYTRKNAILDVYVHFRIVKLCLETIRYILERIERASPNQSNVSTFIPFMDAYVSEESTYIEVPLHRGDGTNTIKIFHSDILLLSMVRLEKAFKAAISADSDAFHKCIFNQNVFDSLLLFQIAMEGIHNEVINAMQFCCKTLVDIFDDIQLDKTINPEEYTPRGQIGDLKIAYTNFLSEPKLTSSTTLTRAVQNAVGFLDRTLQSILVKIARRVSRIAR